jgi:hypothetical protein
MRHCILIVALAVLSIGAIAQDCVQRDFADFDDVNAPVVRVLVFSWMVGPLARFDVAVQTLVPKAWPLHRSRK